MSLIHGIGELTRAVFVTPVEQPHALEPRRLRRSRIVAVITLVVGAVVLWAALRIAPGDPMFYPATLGLAAVWAIGGFAAGRPHLGWVRTRRGELTRPVLQPFLIGLALVALFIAGAVVVARIPVLREPVDRLLDHAQFGSLPVVLALTVLNGVVEELFFRGTLYNASPARWAIPGTVIVYAAVTAGSGVVLLVFAGALLGLVTALQRRVSGGVLAPIITHITWSSAMLLLLPPVLGALG